MPTTLRKIPTSGGSRAQPGRKNPRAKIAVRGNRGIKIVRAVNVRRPAAALYQFWRDVENLAQVIRGPVTITANSDTESHWVVSAPAGRVVEWDSLIINDESDRLIAWRSREGADVDHAGSVRFESARDGESTEVTVALEYDPPGGKLGAAVAKLTRHSAAAQVDDALGRLKALMETEEISAHAGRSGGVAARRRKIEK